MTWLNAALAFLFVCNIVFMLGAAYVLMRILDTTETSQINLQKAASHVIEVGKAPLDVLVIAIDFIDGVIQELIISGLAGLRSVDPEILELTSTMGASKFKTFLKIRFPASLPQLMSGLKVAATLAVTGAVVGEFVGAN